MCGRFLHFFMCFNVYHSIQHCKSAQLNITSLYMCDMHTERNIYASVNTFNISAFNIVGESTRIVVLPPRHPQPTTQIHNPGPTTQLWGPYLNTKSYLYYPHNHPQTHSLQTTNQRMIFVCEILKMKV